MASVSVRVLCNTSQVIYIHTDAVHTYTVIQTMLFGVSAEGAAVASCRYLLSDSRPASMLPQNQPKRKSRVSCNHTLTLFVFLEDSDALRGPGHCTTSHWGQQMERVHELRGMLDGLVHSQQKKFKQATHSALNKLLCNYGTHIKVECGLL